MDFFGQDILENWNGNHHIDDPDDTLEPWDDPFVKERIANVKEKEDETANLITKPALI